MNAKTINFGEHITLDGYDGNFEKLNNKAAVMRFLSDLPKKLDMGVLAEPQLHWAEPNHLKDPGGWTGITLIVESHISIHTFPGRKFASADVYTCKNGMDVDLIVSFFKELFGFEDVETNFIKRGTRYPAENLI